jgi:hypothetical protein
MAAYDYPLLSLFWTMLEFFALLIWFFAIAAVIIDIFRSPDIGGWAKALWFLFVLFMPIVGLVVYLVVRGTQMSQRAYAAVEADVGPFDSGGTTADELGKLADLRDRGAITADEFEKQKATLLS